MWQFGAAPVLRLRRALRPIRADAADDGMLRAARALLAQRLRQRISDAYRIAAVVKVVDCLPLVDDGAADPGSDAMPARCDVLSSFGALSPLAPPFPLRLVPGAPLLVAQSARFVPNAGSTDAALTYDAEWQIEYALSSHDRIDFDDAADAPPALALKAAHDEAGKLLEVLAQHQADRDARSAIVSARAGAASRHAIPTPWAASSTAARSLPNGSATSGPRDGAPSSRRPHPRRTTH